MLEIDIKKGLRDFDLDVKMVIKEGEILMLVGDNGCGKTSLLNLVAGLQDPDEGRIALDGRPLFDSGLKIRVAPEGRNIGYVFQSYALFPHMSVYDNVAFGLRTRRLSRRAIESRVMEHLKAAGLWDIRKASNSRSGSMINALASATRCLCPPETSTALAFLISQSPAAFRCSITLDSIAFRESPLVRRPKATLSYTLM